MMLLGAVLLAAATAAAVYLTVACVCLAGFARRPYEYASKEFLPSFTILKPVAGIEPELFENLASFCDQDYNGAFDIIFCLQERADSAFAVVEEVVGQFPTCRTAIALGGNAAMANPKIANIAKAGVEPKGEIVVIADSDIRVGRSYLRALAASFAGASVGAATCLYSGRPANVSAISRLGALGIDDGFAPSVLVALMLGPMRFCLGATMAVRRRLLNRIGGLPALGNTIADDHRLGELVTQWGYRVELSRYVVSTTVPETALGALWSHELRWARINFALAPVGYSFSFLMYAVPLALFYLAVSRNLLVGAALLALVLALRLALHHLARIALRITTKDDVALVPARDFLSLAVWAVSLVGRAVTWRGKRYVPTRR